MIDETFLRQTAALQANLKMLESQQDALSDFQDMQALRQYKARLVDYIEAHSKAGHLPPDPFQVIQQRLIAVSEFFIAADQECQQLTRWKKNWIKDIPNISLSDIQSAKTELSHLVAELPHVQQRLWQMISQLDWDTSSRTVDLHPELLACAQCVDGLNLSKKLENRHDLYQFAKGEGKLANAVSSHLTAMGMRIDELMSLHEKHQALLAEAEAHLAKENFRSAEQLMGMTSEGKFADIDYSKAESGLERQISFHGCFEALDSALEKRLANGELKAVRSEIEVLRGKSFQPNSELGAEISALSGRMQCILASCLRRRMRRRMVVATVVILIFATGIAWIQHQIQSYRPPVNLLLAFGNGLNDSEINISLPEHQKITLCWCPPGRFRMGSPVTEDGHHIWCNEGQTSVRLSQGFWISKTEVTQAQWQAVMGNNSSQFKGDSLPVENVSWYEAQEFITKVNSSTVIPAGWKMELPTEAQWEYACRAGEAGPYSGGSIDQVAWYDLNSGNKTHQVGTKKANAWGLYDMHGNVEEWCIDGWNENMPWGKDPQTPWNHSRAQRGGSWRYGASNCRAAARVGGGYPDERENYLGFRPALVPSE